MREEDEAREAAMNVFESGRGWREIRLTNILISARGRAGSHGTEGRRVLIEIGVFEKGKGLDEIFYNQLYPADNKDIGISLYNYENITLKINY